MTDKKITEKVIEKMWTEIDSNHQEGAISHLCFYRNEMGDSVAMKLAEKIGDYRISCLYIWSNSLSDASISYLAKSLSSSTCCLETLDLSRNDITDEGAFIIANYFANSSLSNLDLSHNLIGDEGFIALLDRLDLHHLSLSSCKVTLKGTKYLIEKAKKSYRIDDVNLLGNLEIPFEYFFIIEMALERNRLIKHKAGLSLLKFSHVFNRISLPRIPPEVRQMIIDSQIDPYVCHRDALILKRVLFDESFRGWITSPHPFSMKELIEISRFLLNRKDDLVSVNKLRHECHHASKKIKKSLKILELCSSISYSCRAIIKDALSGLVFAFIVYCFFNIKHEHELNRN